MTPAETFLMRCSTGGAIVSSSQLTVTELAAARAQGRVHMVPEPASKGMWGFAFVYMPDRVRPETEEPAPATVGT